MKYQIKAYNLQELGQRANQEDSLFPALGQSTTDCRLFVLCDGMGGHEKGEVASARCASKLVIRYSASGMPANPSAMTSFVKPLPQPTTRSMPRTMGPNAKWALQ